MEGSSSLVGNGDVVPCALCREWHSANITKVYSRELFDIKYTENGTKASMVPLEIEFSKYYCIMYKIYLFLSFSC